MISVHLVLKGKRQIAESLMPARTFSLLRLTYFSISLTSAVNGAISESTTFTWNIQHIILKLSCGDFT